MSRLHVTPGGVLNKRGRVSRPGTRRVSAPAARKVTCAHKDKARRSQQEGKRSGCAINGRSQEEGESITTCVNRSSSMVLPFAQITTSSHDAGAQIQLRKDRARRRYCAGKASIAQTRELYSKEYITETARLIRDC